MGVEVQVLFKVSRDRARFLKGVTMERGVPALEGGRTLIGTGCVGTVTFEE